MTVSTKSMLLGAVLVLAGAAGKDALTAAIPAAHAQGQPSPPCRALPVDTNSLNMRLAQLAQEGYEYKGGILVNGPGASASNLSYLVGCK